MGRLETGKKNHSYKSKRELYPELRVDGGLATGVNTNYGYPHSSELRVDGRLATEIKKGSTRVVS